MAHGQLSRVLTLIRIDGAKNCSITNDDHSNSEFGQNSSTAFSSATAKVDEDMTLPEYQ